ncbi:GXWXG protein-domain-containing protein [Ilyonectria destructans]|nr:GXWXG protein-domain-containing protein [Ilyonectria destructans]
MATPEQRLVELTKVEGRLEESTLAQVFDQLKPIESEFMIGKWKGGSFESGHPVHEQLGSLKWAGKDFRSLRDFKFRGVVSAAMVYDTLPIIDQFRFVSETMVMGAVKGL